MPQRTTPSGAVGNARPDDVDLSVSDHAADHVVIGPCGHYLNVSRTIDDDPGNIMVKLRRKFFDYLRRLTE